MGLFESIEKLITEHGSAAIISQQLSFAKEQFVALERKVSELQLENGKLHAKLEREHLDHDKAQQELQRLQKEHEEEVVIHSFLEFRRGKRTQNKWMPFCPKCHAPATITQSASPQAYCPACDFVAYLDRGGAMTLDLIVKQLPP
jgi:hypothetical protein